MCRASAATLSASAVPIVARASWKLVRAVSDNTLGPAEASAVKVFGTESAVEVYRLLQGILGN